MSIQRKMHTYRKKHSTTIHSGKKKILFYKTKKDVLVIIMTFLVISNNKNGIRQSAIYLCTMNIEKCIFRSSGVLNDFPSRLLETVLLPLRAVIIIIIIIMSGGNGVDYNYRYSHFFTISSCDFYCHRQNTHRHPLHSLHAGGDFLA